MGNIGEWLRCVENKEFLKYFGAPETAGWDDRQGFGMERLKVRPVGFPADYEHMRYLRMKDYSCWHSVGEDFFDGDGWLDGMEKIFKVAKPMLDFTNAVIDDYE